MTPAIIIAKISNDLKNAGAPEWTFNVGYALGILLVLGVVLWLGIKAIKKVLGTNTTKDKTTKAPTKAKKQVSKNNKKSSDDYDDEL